MINFRTVDYLATENNRQKHCYELLDKHNIIEILSRYSPVVAGTIPINIDIPSSDVDIICHVADLDAFERLLRDNFGGYKAFSVSEQQDNIFCKFNIDNQSFEIYAANIPVFRQNAYRHMLIEYRILNLLGEKFRRQVIELKLQGLKTEPAFAHLLKLRGNPFQEILELENYSDRQIRNLYSRK